MKLLVISLLILSTKSFAGVCDQILDLGFPVMGSCSATSVKISNINSQKKIVEANVCWGSYGSSEDGENAVAVEMLTEQGEFIEYAWEMPTGRQNRKNVNDYTYYGTWKKGVFFEDQTTIKDDTTFFKPFLRQGVVINYKQNQIELVKTYKKFFGRTQVIFDAYLDCDNLGSRESDN